MYCIRESPRWGIYHESFNKFRRSSYRDPDPNLPVAADIVAYIRHRYLHQLSVNPAADATRVQEDPAGSALSRGSEALQPYLTNLEQEEFPADLFDSEEDPRDGSVFHEQCEVIWHKFPSPAGRNPPNPTSGPTFLWVRAEYVRILEYFKSSGENGVVITGQAGIEIPRWSYEIPGAKVIYTSSPDQSRWKKLRQEEYYPHVLIMNPYTRNEALLLAIPEAEARPLKVPSDLPRSPQRKLELCATAMKFFEQNPGPRYFIVNAWTEEEPDSKPKDLEETSWNVILFCPKEPLVQLFSPGSNATSKDFSHTIVSVYRDPGHNDYYRTNRSFVKGKVPPLNTKIMKSLSTRLESLLQEERRGFFKLIIKLDIHVNEVIFDYNTPKRLDYSVLCYSENPEFTALDFLIRDTNNQYYGIQVTLATTQKIVPNLHNILAERGVTDSQYTHIFVQARGGYQDGDKDKFTVSHNWHKRFGFKIQVAWVDCPLDPLI
ncbi:MAG: hypothetical protein Q9180_002391 [Flavoplaca navasiana]